ncbi:hypothetical protein CC1G_00042 [Coprinopsis cinerea okayama7|uniref:Mediator of RNA polymerase II transcription subunit 18 n=1 Tax=Coprinopsis cinerea (strain Okayama-7 / 130 / ATCC MYA-4618 / FGSC 9003) TaxID=240176 RepID=A8NWJ2_COPC7|nr:hypothetical protein CC1G_00042 [Coprinopsis cinerea okayama7\|eukprot:XP_001836906.1 hypothetical protein CC1G_00042 [Coprinopsis cinerea okayama7\
MASQGHSYEVSLTGEFFAKDLRPILNRITLNSESAQPIHIREVVFEPLDAQYHRDRGVEPVMLRAKKETSTKDSPWEMYSYLKPESTRTYPDATVRPWATIHVTGDALQFAAALGYIRKTQLYKRGYSFRRGPLIITMFQQEQADPKTEKPIPAHADTLWQVEVKTAAPIRDTPVQLAIDQLLEFQTLMKGLLDLRRQDI